MVIVHRSYLNNTIIMTISSSKRSDNVETATTAARQSRVLGARPFREREREREMERTAPLRTLPNLPAVSINCTTASNNSRELWDEERSRTGINGT